MNKNEFIALAGDAGWTVTGHKWLRLAKADKQIEVWYAGETPRMVSATLRTLSGGCERLNIVRDRATPLVESVLLWVSAAHPLMGLQLMPAAAAVPDEITPENDPVAGKVALSA